MMLDMIATIFKPAAKLVDDLVTTEEERLQIKQVLFDTQTKFAIEAMAHERKMLEAQASVIKAEAQGASAIQRLWRPITMLTFLFLVVVDAFGWLPNRLAPEAWTLLQIGLGGYVVGRSAEKIAPRVVDMMRKD